MNYALEAWRLKTVGCVDPLTLLAGPDIIHFVISLGKGALINNSWLNSYEDTEPQMAFASRKTQVPSHNRFTIFIGNQYLSVEVKYWHLSMYKQKSGIIYNLTFNN